MWVNMLFDLCVFLSVEGENIDISVVKFEFYTNSVCYEWYPYFMIISVAAFVSIYIGPNY